jgi:hypothetical protein
MSFPLEHCKTCIGTSTIQSRIVSLKDKGGCTRGTHFDLKSALSALWIHIGVLSRRFHSQAEWNSVDALHWC